MDKLKILEFLNANADFQLATTEGNIPHVRTLMLHKADETGIYFMVGKFKDVYRQLSLNPNVELCFHKDNFQIRIAGHVESLDKDLELKKEILSARLFMKPWIDNVGFKHMAVFRIKNGIATTWSLETETQPKTFLEL